MKLPILFAIIFLVGSIQHNSYAQEKDWRKASDLGSPMSVSKDKDYFYFGNWQVIPSKSDAQTIDLMPDQGGLTGQYLILKPTTERSAISSYRNDGYHSVDLGFNVYRKGNMLYGNLTSSNAVVFEMEYQGHFLEFKCEYLKNTDQLKLTTSKSVVFYLQRLD